MVRLTGWIVLDPIIALVMSVFVLKAGYEVTMRASNELIDRALPKEEQRILDDCLNTHTTMLVNYHAVRSRSSGNERFIDLHLVVPRNDSVEKAHDMCDHLEQDIREKISGANVIIHAEPCDPGCCPHCAIEGCELRATS